MKTYARIAIAIVLCLGTFGSRAPAGPDSKPIPIHVAVQWHMHQPIYWPYEDIVATSHNPQNTLDVINIVTWPDRVGAYTHYPPASMQKFLDLPHAGAQVSFSGSLIEDLDALAKAGIGFGKDWPAEYRQARTWKTAAGNPRLDLVGFGYHHPLMAFLDYDEIRHQVRTHREAIQKTFGGPPSRGLFPPENAFTLPMVPALVDEGVQWVLVDNVHMDRASKGYPYTPDQKIPPPNPADQVNPAQPAYASLNSQTNTVQAVGRVGLLPHWVEYRDPATGKAVTPGGKPARMIVVPTERSIGYDDSYGDRSPIPRLKDLESLNTDPNHPLLVVLAHDGDNFGASGSRYYLETMNWVRENPDRYVLTTIQDYLDAFPPAASDVIHVEDGSWAGADLGDATFTKWLGPPYKGRTVDFEKGWSSDWDSWAAIVAARNWVKTADAVRPDSPRTAEARRFLMVGLTSCYWYWDGQQQWDQKPSIAANAAVKLAREALGEGFADPVGPSIFPPQRHPYNPGIPQPGGPTPPDFAVYTLVADCSDPITVTLRYRSRDGLEPSPEDTVHGGEWESVPMKVSPMTGTPALPQLAKAARYAARIAGQAKKTVSYFVEAVDARGNRSRSVIRHVAVGDGTGGTPGTDLAWSPPFPKESDPIVFRSKKKAALHWGINGWQLPPRALWPAGSQAWPDGKAVETPMAAAPDGTWTVTLGPVVGQKVDTIEFVFHFSDNTWARDQVVNITDQMRAWRDLDHRPASKSAVPRVPFRPPGK